MENMMTDSAMWALIVGFLTPPILSILQQPTWKEPARAFLAFVWAVVAGGVTAYLTGAFNSRSIISSILLVLVMAIGTYKGFWKPTLISPKIETATSPNTGKRPVGSV